MIYKSIILGPIQLDYAPKQKDSQVSERLYIAVKRGDSLELQATIGLTEIEWDKLIRAIKFSNIRCEV